MIRRRVGRPRGSRDRYGAARRVDTRAIENVTRALSEHLRHVRESANVAVDELAAAIGVQPSTVHRYESGRSVPPFQRLAAISIALGLPLEHLVPEA